MEALLNIIPDFLEKPLCLGSAKKNLLKGIRRSALKFFGLSGHRVSLPTSWFFYHCPPKNSRIISGDFPAAG
jgi:hypothetical protein